MIMNNLEWSVLSYYVIYYEKFKKSHAVNREGSFKSMLLLAPEKFRKNLFPILPLLQ